MGRLICESLIRQYRNRYPAIDGGTMSGTSKYEFSSALSFQGTSSMHALLCFLFGLNRFDADVCVQSANKHKVWP
jgi:hypothetical protein